MPEPDHIWSFREGDGHPGFRALATWSLALLLLVTSCVSSMHEYRGHTVFNPLYLPYLESKSRDHWQMPEEILDALAVSAGDHVADIGAGGGYFTERFSRRVGPDGRVYATDVQEVMVSKLRKRAARHGLANVTVIHAGFDDPGLPPGSCDLIFLSSVYKEIEGRVDYATRMRAALKPGGRVAILEYRPDCTAPGPPRTRRLEESVVVAEMTAGGFALEHRHDFLPREYFLVFTVVSPDPRSTLP